MKDRQRDNDSFEIYYDGVSPEILAMTPEELDKAIKEEEKRLKELYGE